ncbi:MAG: hypothetical protein GX079_02430 [Tissierellia bacterium]|nr:hypothetical protein [Tissierellia bacterium]
MKLDFGEFDKAYNEDLKQRQIEEKMSKTQKNGNLGNFLGKFFVVFLTFFIFALIINGFVELNQIKFENIELAYRIDDLNQEIEQLQIKLNQKTSRTIIEKEAMEKLGMVYPHDAQRISVEQRKSFALYPDGISAIVRDESDQNASGE